MKSKKMEIANPAKARNAKEMAEVPITETLNLSVAIQLLHMKTLKKMRR